MKNSKPYFSKDIEDKVVSVILSELAKDNKTVDEAALRRYIQIGKNEYENGILKGVAEGYYLASVVRDEIAYKVKPPTQEEIDEVIDLAKRNDQAKQAANQPSVGVPSNAQVEFAIKNARASKLSHAMNMIGYIGTSRKAKLGVEAVAVAPQIVESSEPTLETSTA